MAKRARHAKERGQQHAAPEYNTDRCSDDGPVSTTCNGRRQTTENSRLHTVRYIPPKQEQPPRRTAGEGADKRACYQKRLVLEIKIEKLRWNRVILSPPPPPSCPPRPYTPLAQHPSQHGKGLTTDRGIAPVPTTVTLTKGTR